MTSVFPASSADVVSDAGLFAALADLDEPQRVALLQRRMDGKTKPVGSLGQIESLAIRIGLIQGRDDPVFQSPQLLIFAGDHGLASRGVSAYPSDITWQMVANYLDGGAAASVLARQHGLALTVVDVGVQHDFAPCAGLVRRKIAPGTADSSRGTAMTWLQCRQALEVGRDVVGALPGNAVLLGEMGIGNSSAAALLLARLLGADLGCCVGAGTGLDEAGVARKRQVLAEVLSLHQDARTPLQALCAFGGFEVAALVGAMLQAAAERRTIVIDGLIVTAALLVAHALDPRVQQRCVFSHRSGEPGHDLMLRHLHAQPLLDLGMRLGEGSGAALAWPLIVSAARLLREMASFDSAGLSAGFDAELAKSQGGRTS